MNQVKGFVPPPQPFDGQNALREQAELLPGGAVDLSIGTPADPVPDFIAAVLADPEPARPYPTAAGRSVIEDAITSWLDQRLDVSVAPAEIGTCIGTKELVAGLPHLLKLRDPSRDTILYPEVAYPSYAMGAILAGCRAVPVAMDDQWRLDVSSIDPQDAQRALALWVNTPGNPAGGLDDLEEVAEWGRSNGVPVFSDECYVEFTWQGPARSILQYGHQGVVAVHSLSKRSNLAGLRFGFYAGDQELVSYLREARRHQGLMVPGPAQAAAVVALSDQDHVEVQRQRYLSRLTLLIEVLGKLGVEASLPGGAFYLWVPAPMADAAGLVNRLAQELGVVAALGGIYGPRGANHVRLAAVVTDERLALVAQRAGSLS
jgi:aspartate/methionine/tyrosine aminotransferase